MKLLVFAHTPPPLHGQSAMVRTLVEGLRGDPAIEVIHVNPRISRDAADIGRWRPGKILSLLAACLRAWQLRLRHGAMPFYYVPAPAKRGALYRDWLVLLLCRPFFSGLILHWHAVGLGDWLARHATPPERWISRWLLGRAQRAIVLAPELASDAEILVPQRVVVVANGIPDPGPPAPHVHHGRTEVVFLGLGSHSKGLPDTLAAIALVHQRAPGTIHLTAAGSFESAADAAAFRDAAAKLGPGVAEHIGPVDDQRRHTLLSSADVFCFPTRYAHEGQPLTIIETLAHDVPIVTTRWRAIPGMLPSTHTWLVEPGQIEQIAHALQAAARAGSPAGALRRYFLDHFTRERHLAAMKDALRALP